MPAPPFQNRQESIRREDHPFSNWEIFQRLVGLCAHRKLLLFSVLLLQALLLVMQVAGLSYLGVGIDFLRFQYDRTGGPPTWPFGLAPPANWAPFTIVLISASAALIAAGLRGALLWAASTLTTLLIHRHIIPDLQRRAFSKLQQMHQGFFEAQSIGGLINRISGDINTIRLFVESVLIETLIVALALGAYAYFMFQISPFLTVVCLSTFPLILVAILWFSKTIRPRYRQRKRAFDDLIFLLSETIQGMQTVIVFNLGEEMQRRFKRINGEIRDLQQSIFLRFSIFQPSVNLLTHLSLLLLLFVGGRMAVDDGFARWTGLDGPLPVGAGLLVFGILLQQFQNRIGVITNVANSIQDSFSAAERVFEILDVVPEIAPRASARALPHPVEGELTFERVTFGYLPGRPALSDISFSIRPGETLALAGETGSGKSTLLHMIPRFFDPGSGVVRLDGLDLRDLSTRALRENIALVSQEPLLFHDTITNNIRFGRPAASAGEVETAARLCAAHDFICSLSHGYETILTEGGTNLSGGQKQRLALARAMIIRPRLLLLDDPTSALDPETESEVMTAIDRAAEQRTTLLVAHRVGMLMKADRVLLLDKGRVLALGTHAELMGSCRPYREAVLAQMEPRGKDEAASESLNTRQG